MSNNPLIPGFNPDPSIVRVGDDFYLATSSFEYLPGIPIYYSKDLVSWTHISNVADRAGQIQAVDVPTGGGAWAPTIRFHNGTFYLAVADAMGRGLLIFTADEPAGPWSNGNKVKGVSGIDPDLAWDDEGNCYMTFSGLEMEPGDDFGNHKGIQQVRIDDKTFEALEPARSLWSGTGLMFPEAPHIYRIGDWWYLLIAEGGTERGHCVSIARSHSPQGPYEGCPSNPVLSARSTIRRVQNTGHGDLFESKDGRWFMVLLGMQTGGMTRAFSPLGRQTFLTEVKWQNEWFFPQPVIVPEDRCWPQYSCDFLEGKLDPSWISIRRFPSDCSTISDGKLLIRGEGRNMDNPAPAFVGRRVSSIHCRISAAVESITGTGGLSIRYDEKFHFDIELSEDKITARAKLSTIVHEIQRKAPAAPVVLYIESRAPSDDVLMVTTSDYIYLGYLDKDGNTCDLASFDGRFLTAETACSFTGRVAGVYCVTGIIEIDWYREVK